MKVPWLAALVNVIPLPLGFGYLYLGRPVRFAQTFLGALLAAGLSFMALVGAFILWYIESGFYLFLLVLAPIPVLLLPVITARDAYRLAQAQSASIERATDTAAETRCFSCGQDNPPEASFCGNCGSPLPAH